MIVEFAGCTGSGKTTLVEKVYSLLVGVGIPVARVRDVIWGGRLLSYVPTEGLQNVALEVALTPFVLSSVPRYADFLVFAYRALQRYADSPYLGFKAWRGVWRQIGLHALLRGMPVGPRVVLLDEGTIQTAHYIFVQTKRLPDKADLDDFCRLVPRPELIVCVEAPRAVLIERMRNRTDPPRRGMTLVQMERLVDHGLAVFEYIRRFALAASGWPLLCADGLGMNTLNVAAERIVERILRERMDARNHP
jgi:hypothetical protein